MAVQLNHTIVHARDKKESATFLAEILGLPSPVEVGPFLAVEVTNDVTLDFMDSDADKIVGEHYAFLVDDDEFDEIFGRIKERGMTYWAEPGRSRPGEINTRWGGRGVYFDDPNGHYLEILTRPDTDEED